MNELTELDNLIDVEEEEKQIEEIDETARLTYAIIDKNTPIKHFYAFGFNADNTWQNLEYFEYDIPDHDSLECIELPSYIAEQLDELNLSALDINDALVDELLLVYKAENALLEEERWVCRIFNDVGKLIHKEVAMVYPAYDRTAMLGEQISYADGAWERLVDNSPVLSDKIKKYLNEHANPEEEGGYSFDMPGGSYGYLEPVKSEI